MQVKFRLEIPSECREKCKKTLRAIFCRTMYNSMYIAHTLQQYRIRLKYTEWYKKIFKTDKRTAPTLWYRANDAIIRYVANTSPKTSLLDQLAVSQTLCGLSTVLANPKMTRYFQY